ncbi:MAG TPA: copper transporter [Acidimicrobiia bacterium]
MINFRFHLVSLIAVFLALGLGVVMGATVIDEAIVDGLNARINDVEDEADAQRAENSELREEIARLEAFVGDEFAVAGTLDDVPVPVIAPRGVTGDDARSTVAMLQVAGADAPGVLWLEEKWQLEDAETREELAEILDVPRARADVLREQAWARLAVRIAAGAAPAPPQPDVLQALVDAAYISFQAVGDGADDLDLTAYPEAGARVLLVDQSDASDQANELVATAMSAFVDAGVPQVVGEVYREEEDGPNRGIRLAIVRDDDVLIEVVSTVDNLEATEGRVAATWALADFVEGIVGHYGYGDTAEAPLPDSPR